MNSLVDALLPALVLGAIIVVCLIKSGVLSSSAFTDLFTPPYRARRLLSDNEMHFAEVLERALPDYKVIPQVSFGAFLRVREGLAPASATTAFNRVSSKRADWVVCDRRYQVLCIVELDDRSHDLEKDRRRDSYTAAAGLPTLRVPSRNKPDASALRKAVLACMEGQAVTTRI
jgi:hypothetical protein